jgi:putative endonuclease
MNGYVEYTRPFLPIELVFYCAIPDKYKAYQFERYLKTGSGRAFFNKHLV